MTTFGSASNMADLRPAAFVDRDGVINEERDYVHRVDDFVLLPGALEGLARLNAAGYPIVVVTNQAGIARGYYDERAFALLSHHLRQLLVAEGITLAGIYHCPHHPTAGIGPNRVACDCRKPKPGMILKAARDLKLDLHGSVMIGDKRSDIEAARNAGVGTAILVSSGHAVTSEDRACATVCCEGLREAALWWVHRPTLGRLAR